MAQKSTTATSSKKKSSGSNEDYVPNKTYPTKPRSRQFAIDQAVDFAVNTAKRDADGKLVKAGRATFITGTHGSGKTSRVKARVEELGYRYLGLSLPTIEIPNMYLPIPKREQLKDHLRWVLEMHVHQNFKPRHEGEEFVFVGEDARRVNPSVMSALFEIVNEDTLTGLHLEGMAAKILVDNPVGEGYQGVQSGDIAYESRFAHFSVTANDIPWREHLAAKFAETDLTPIFEAWAKSWDEPMRRVLCARVIDHICEVTGADLPPILGLPLMPSGRQRVLDAGGNDRTKEVLQIFSAAFQVPYRERIPDQLNAALGAALTNGWNVHLVGPHGVAKTATIKALPSQHKDLDLTLYSAANMSMGDLVAQVPADGKVVSIVNERLKAKPGRRLLVAFDEGFRAPKNVKPQMLEVFQERSVGGEKMGEFGEVAGVWMLNNPAKVGNLRFNVGTADEALCSRFTLNIEVTDEDTAWRGYLTETYGEETVKPFLEWRAHSLKDEERAFISPRTLEIMIELYVNIGVDAIENGIPYLGKERVPVRLHELKARLAKKRVFGPTELFAEIDDIENRLLDSSLDEVARKDLEDAVIRVLRKADLTELTPHESECVRLVKALPSDLRISLIRTDNPERQGYWSKVFGQTLV